MAVLVRGMEMPKSCGNCYMFSFLSDSCRITNHVTEEMNDKMFDKRFDDCPLVPVPPHGLIDRERILDSIRIELAQVNAVNDMEDYDSWMRVFDYVRKFPTVIPESEEG